MTFSARRNFYNITTVAATAAAVITNSHNSSSSSNNNNNNQRSHDTAKSSSSISGMNDSSNNNSNNNWHPLLYISPWEQQQQMSSSSTSSLSSFQSHWFLQPLEFAPAATTAAAEAVDVASRHLIQLLQEVYHYGQPAPHVVHGNKKGDHVPLSRCHQVLHSLVALPVHVTGRAQRADAILVLLQLIDEKQQQQQSQQRALVARATKAVAMTTTTTTTTTAVLGDNTNKKPDYPSSHRSAFAHLGPNHETYKIVLQLYATTTTTNDDNDDSSMTIPLRAQELIQQMQNEYQVHGNLQLKPHAYHYNRVLFCWKECQHHVNRIMYATQFFLQHLQSMDANSYVLIMRICSSCLGAVVVDPQQQQHGNNTNNNNSQQQQQAAILGAKAAIRIWQVTIEQQQQQQQAQSSSVVSSLDLPSHFYSHFLQAIRPLSDQTGGDGGDGGGGGTTNDFELRKEYFAQCYCHARNHGKLNAFVLQEFLVHVQSKTLTRRLLGHDLMQVIHGVSPATRAVQVLLQNMPSSWKEHAN